MILVIEFKEETNAKVKVKVLVLGLNPNRVSIPYNVPMILHWDISISIYISSHVGTLYFT